MGVLEVPWAGVIPVRWLTMMAAVLLAGVLLAGLTSCIPAPPPAYTEARAFPSCVVPLSIDSNVPNGAWVRAAFDDIGKHSGYRFSRGTRQQAADRGVRVVWAGPSSLPGWASDVTTPTIRRSGGRTWSAWVIRITGTPSWGLALHSGGHTMGLPHWLSGPKDNAMQVPVQPGAYWVSGQRSQMRSLGRMSGC